MQIEQIAEKSAEAIRALILEKGEKIEAAINDAAEQALSHRIKLDLGKNMQTDKLSIASTSSAEIVSRFDEPNQPELPL